MLKPFKKEEEPITEARLQAVIKAWPNNPQSLEEVDLSIVKELFGQNFLTENYHISELKILEE